MSERIKKYSFLIFAFVFGAGVVWWFVPVLRPATQDCSKNYPFVSSEIDCETIDEKINQVENLKGDINTIVDEEKTNGHIVRASVFYRDLNTRRWFGIDDIDKFFPASLIKLPVSIMYYKVAELDPTIMDQKLEIAKATDGGGDNTIHYAPVQTLTEGKSYPVKEMIHSVLVYSDNTPFSTLLNAAELFRSRVLSDLGVYDPPTDSGVEAWNITARSYANIFRILYNASYLNVKSSNEILDLLSQSKFDKGITKGVPSGTKVAQKFGEANEMKDGQELHILNNCGIVYKPENPYILCVLTEGKDYGDMEKVIQRIATSSYTALK
ncbi:MAG: serine hydrolase [Candidatus Moraniibacteriota bacterium]